MMLLHLLLQACVPYHRAMIPSLLSDRTILDEIKEQKCRADAPGLGETMQIIQYESREPEANTRKWEAKVYEEVCLAPLVGFFLCPWKCWKGKRLK